ncbi:MAG: hypothetical protein R3A79_26775 [Nannocystaceae bacterium]
MSGHRGPAFVLLAALAGAACGRGAEVAKAPAEASGLHEERWYGWGLLLPDGCEAPAEERFGGAPIGRARWVCPGLTITLDASPLADPMHHTASLRFRPGAALCGDGSEVERVALPEGAPPPTAEVTYYEPVLGHALAVRRAASDRAASLVVLGDPTRCAAMAGIVESLRPRGERLAAPSDELRTPGFALPLPDAGCHRHFDWAQCKPGGGRDVHVRCDALTVDWWGRRASEASSSAEATRGVAAERGVVREAVEGREGVFRWRAELADGLLQVEAGEEREDEVLAALARARVASTPATE